MSKDPKQLSANLPIDPNQENSLIIALLNGTPEECKLLIEKMSTEAINAETQYGKTILHLAADNGWGDLCEIIKARINNFEESNSIKNNPSGEPVIDDTATLSGDNE